MTRTIQKMLVTALIVELVAVGVLAGLGPVFPSGVDAQVGWSFLSTHGFVLAHSLLGALVLVQALVLAVTTRPKLIPGVILAGVAVAVISGAAYVSAQQPGAALGVMTVGWLVSLTGAIVELVRQRRHPRAGH